MKYLILKHIKNNGIDLKVILIDTHGEVLEFEDFQEAEKLSVLSMLFYNRRVW